jgi:CBS domain-containing protein
MLNEAIRYVMDKERLLVAAPHTSVRDAARMMAERRASAVVVVEGGRLAGIFTERDAVFRVLAEGRVPDTTAIAEVMTRDPKSVAPDETFGYALLVMHENGFRHVPVVEDGTPIGMVTARDALDPDLEEFESEARRRQQIRRNAQTPGG